MKKYVVFFVAMIFLGACGNNRPDKPRWINSSDSLTVSSELIFESPDRNWQIMLLTPVQPLSLSGNSSADHLTVTLGNLKNITVGPSMLCLSQGDCSYFYPFVLHNPDHGSVSNQEYRSPKTVNPDSSLYQQKISYVIDASRNLLPDKKTLSFFSEQQITLPPIAGTFYGVDGDPLSCYYVQPGSCVAVPVNARRRSSLDDFEIVAGPLSDKYGNQIANGTIVTFFCQSQQRTSQVQVAARDGYAHTVIASSSTQAILMYAKIDEISSKPFLLR